MPHSKAAKQRYRAKRRELQKIAELGEKLFEFREDLATRLKEKHPLIISSKTQFYMVISKSAIKSDMYDECYKINNNNILNIIFKYNRVVHVIINNTKRHDISVEDVSLQDTGIYYDNHIDTDSVGIVEDWVLSTLKRIMAVKRTAKFKEELIAAAWAPERVEKMLAAGADFDDL